ncbi:hypothetical protein ACUH78_19385, partial [Thauera sp. ZXT1-4]
MERSVVLRWSASFILFVASTAFGAEVELAGVFGKRAVLVVNGGAPQTLSVGQTSREGVKLVEVANPAATIEVEGQRRRVSLGEAPLRLSVAAGPESAAQTLRLPPDGQGHYWTQGAVNGASLRFM